LMIGVARAVESYWAAAGHEAPGPRLQTQQAANAPNTQPTTGNGL